MILALEPEAAAIFCEKELLTVNEGKIDKTDYLTVDCGGGTVDITAHRLSKDEDNNISIQELAPPQGCAKGGNSVNHLFEEMLWRLFTITDQEQKDEIKTTYAAQWTTLISKEFEKSKQSFDNTDKEFFIVMSPKLSQGIERITKKKMQVLTDDFKEYKVTWDEDENALVLDFSTMCRLFEPVVFEIIAQIDQSLERHECHRIRTVLLAGGFGASYFLFEEVKSAFTSKDINVVKSPTPLISVLKGAVLYGQKQDVIKSRKMPQSIGIKISQRYDKSIHDLSDVEAVEGQTLCRKVFHPFIKVNDNVEAGSIISHNLQPVSSTSGTCKVDIYATHSSEVKYVTDQGCYKLGEMIIDNPSLNPNISGFISVAMDFSGTDIKVLAYSQNMQKELNISLNFIPEKSFIPSM